MTSKPPGVDRGHTFINQNHCHAKKQNLFTTANAALSLGNRCMEVQLGEQALLPSCGLQTATYGHVLHSITFPVPLGHTQVETHWRQWNCTSL